jgi:hypothetical protein
MNDGSGQINEESCVNQVPNEEQSQFNTKEEVDPSNY